MKKHFLLWILLFASVFCSYAQSYQPFPTGPSTWEVARCFSFYQSGWYDKYTFTMDGTDTLNNGELFKKVFITNHHLPGTVHDTIYPKEFFGGLRESNKRVFIYQVWASVDTSVQMVYDFNNTNVGDTIYTNVLSGNPNLLGHLVTETDSVLVGSNYHKRLHLQYIHNSYYSEYWIEGIGSSWGLPFASFWSVTDNSYDLTCFYENQNLKYENPSPAFSFCQPPQPDIACEIVSNVSNQNEEKGSFFKMYPNPTTNDLSFEINDFGNKELSLNIYNNIGILVLSKTITQDQFKISLENLKSGVYIVEIRSNELTESKRLVIQK